jgi:hypothetical protein
LARRFDAYDSFNLERGVQSWKEWMHWQGHRQDLGNISMKRLGFRRVANLITDLREPQELIEHSTCFGANITSLLVALQGGELGVSTCCEMQSTNA